MSPPPWVLGGRALVAVYGGAQPGALMLVRYAYSPVGPYDELLWVALRPPSPAGVRPRVTDIVVSTQESVTWGRRNWGIPKTKAHFEWQGAPGKEQVRVTQAGQLVAHLAVRGGGPRLPVTTAVVPLAWRTLAQPALHGGEDWLLTPVSAGGSVRQARLSVISGDRFHPGLLERRPRVTLDVPAFRLVFPTPARQRGPV
ncbi:hypothetical protein LAJ19_03800 [Deinococcus taeanensis]|uniref:hypothetical protein n=1 Tax=Deinococcus taeanensis TaxID=2737050 RepID=UPI001CDB6270|nr:hypothetical protein [Deinococcus taeanensis]UBV43347.1 hypothetical protein LAJ19_03800 [Deinococcus taeanensis]